MVLPTLRDVDTNGPTIMTRALSIDNFTQCTINQVIWISKYRQRAETRRKPSCTGTRTNGNVLPFSKPASAPMREQRHRDLYTMSGAES